MSMNISPVSTRLPAGQEAVSADVVGSKMSKSLQIVMGWQKFEPPSRLTIGSGDLRKITNRVREQPFNFMVMLFQSLMTAKNVQSLCRAGWKCSRILLGEEDHPQRHKARYATKTLQEIKKFATSLKEHTNGIKNKFRLLRGVVIEIHNDLSKVVCQRQRSAFFAQLSRHLSKDVRICEDTLRKVHDELEDIENSLSLVTGWWQQVEFEVNYLEMNGESRLALKNTVILQEVKDSFMKLRTYFSDYLDKMCRLYDENFVHLSDKNRENLKKVQDCTNLVVSKGGRLEPGNK